jgi:ankyrin repeat protein
MIIYSYIKIGIFSHWVSTIYRVGLKPEPIFKIMKNRVILIVIMALIIPIGFIESQEIHQAAAKGEISIVKSLLAADAKLINSLDNYNRTPLHWACRIDNIELVRLLIEQGSDLNRMDMNGIAPIHSLASRGFVKAAELLIERGANINIQDKFGLVTPLHMASIAGHYQMVVLLTEKGADANITDKSEKTILHSATQNNQLKVIEYIISEYPNLLNTQDFDGNTALHLAVSKGFMEVADLLISNGINVNTRNTIGQTAYNIAQNHNSRELIDFLISKGAENNPQIFPVLKGDYLGQRKPGKQPEIFLKGIISTSEGIHGTVAFSPENNEIAWNSGGTPGLQIMKIRDGQWSPPSMLPFREKYAVDAPFYSFDGKRLYFLAGKTDEQGMSGRMGFWYFTKTEKGWENPQPLDSVANSVPMHFQGSMDQTGNIYFGGLYVSKFENGKYLTPVKLPFPINIEKCSTIGPCISPDGSYIIFNRVTPPPSFSSGVYISFRISDDRWSEPVNLSEKLDLDGSMFRLSPDGKYFFFQSSRPGGAQYRSVFWVDASIIDVLRPN